MGVERENPSCADHRFRKECNFSDSPFIFAAIKSKVRMYTLHIPQKVL